jgi:ATP-dependent Clp protease ATP-binding subunit ClpB
MSENTFGARLRSSLSDAKLPDVLAASDDQFDVDLDDETAKMLVIPISQEIAPDFQLIGYDGTIRRMEEVLTQRGKQRNVHLFGNNGVGKTALVQGLVQRKNRGDLSTHMFKRMFYRLNNSRLLHMDDTTEINKQFDQAVEEFGRYDVMVIENFYTLMTYLKLKGANSVMVAFLEALSRRKLQAVITSSTRERTLIINEIPEIHEFFLPEEIPEPNNDQLLNILRGVRRSYEVRYDITIPDAALIAIRDLTQKYRVGMEGWAQPGRSLILQDRSIAQFSVRMNSRSPELAALEAEMATAENEIESLKESGQSAHNFERRTTLEQRVAEVRPKVDTLRQQWVETTAPIQSLQTDKTILDKKLHTLINKRRRLQDMRGDNIALMAQNTDASRVSDDLSLTNRMIDRVREGIKELDDNLGKINLSQIRDHVVTPEHVAETFSELSGIPANQLNADERERLLNMEAIMGERVFGQPEAIKLIATAVRRAKAKLSAMESGPKGSFLLLGPSGVGKTELTKALAEFLFRDEKAMVRIDMSEFTEKQNVSRLVGAPPGLVGYDEGGVLTNAVSARPESVVNFDEAEKAAMEVFKLLLGVLSDGRLTDGRGETVDFRETYCMFTSNLGGRHFSNPDNPDTTFEQAQKLAMKDVEAFFPSEFIGRLDSIIFFHRLELPMLVRVAKRRIKEINTGIGADKLHLQFDDADVERFCLAHQDPRYGARPILKAMKSTLEGDLAISILSRTDDSPGVFHTTYVDDRLIMDFTKSA